MGLKANTLKPCLVAALSCAGLWSPASQTRADSAAKVINAVPPDYPKDAYKSHLEGFVDLEFTVDAAGKVHNISVLSAEPRQTFEVAAVKALQQWTFNPAVQGDQKIESHARQRIEFKP